MAYYQPAPQPFLGVKVKPGKVGAMLAELSPYLVSGESVLALATTSSLRPLLSHVLVTTQRIMAFSSADLARSGMKIQVRQTDVVSADVRSSFAHPAILVVTLRNRQEIEFGDIQPADSAMLLQLTQLAASATVSPPGVAGQAGWRFNAPPGWPVPPADWTPPPGWQPDPAWPAAPPGWQLWVQSSASPAPRDPASGSETPPGQDHPGLVQTAPVAASAPPASLLPPVVQQPQSYGLFGGKKRAADLEAENAQLRLWIQQMQGMDALQLTVETERLRTQVSELQQQVADRNAALNRVLREIVRTEDVALLQEAGVYDYRHPLDDAVAYKGRLEQLKDQYKSMARGDAAVLASTTW